MTLIFNTLILSKSGQLEKKYTLKNNIVQSDYVQIFYKYMM